MRFRILTHAASCLLCQLLQAKAAGADASAKKVSFNRLLLRFGTLHEGFQACRQVFSDLVGGLEDGELSQAQLQEACRTLGYNLDDASLATIFDGTDIDGSRALNVHEFLATMAILHILKARWLDNQNSHLLTTFALCMHGRALSHVHAAANYGGSGRWRG